MAADEVDLEREEGAPLRVTWATGETRDGVIVEVEEERRLRSAGRTRAVPSRVEWTLDDDPGGTRVVVEERPLVPLGSRRAAALAPARARDRAHRRARPPWAA